MCIGTPRTFVAVLFMPFPILRVLSQPLIRKHDSMHLGCGVSMRRGAKCRPAQSLQRHKHPYRNNEHRKIRIVSIFFAGIREEGLSLTHEITKKRKIERALNGEVHTGLSHTSCLTRKCLCIFNIWFNKEPCMARKGYSEIVAG